MFHRIQIVSKMFVVILPILLLLAPQLAWGEATTTSSAPAATHSVNVGADGLKFTPNTLNANVGDIILFRFYPQNHSVARAGYKAPCIPYELTGAGNVGFWSGFEPTQIVSNNPPTYSVTVNDTEPIFFYCSAPGACITDGMVGVINPNSTETLAVQQAYAANSTFAFSPGEGFPVEKLPPTSSTSTSSPTSTPTSTPTSSTTPSSIAVADSKSTLSAGAIAGIAIGGAAVLLLAGALIYFCGRQRTVKEIMQTQGPMGPPSYQPAHGHMSLASSAGYLPKYPPVGIDPLGPGRYSSQGMYGHSAPDTESYRSRSPPVDEGMLPRMQYSGSGTTSPARVDSPLMRRPVPGSPNSLGSPTRPMRQNQSNPMSPMDDTLYQNLSADPPPMRFNPILNQTGPHELSVENERGYSPYMHDSRSQGAKDPTPD